MYEKAIVTKEEFEKGLREVVDKVIENGQQYSYVGISLVATKGIVYVVEKLGAIFILKLVEQFLNEEKIIAARSIYGCKSLLVLSVEKGVVKVTLHINDVECATAVIENREDIPDVRVPMIMGQKVLYLIDED